MTNMTQAEFDKFYDSSDDQSFGYQVTQVDKLIASLYKCTNKDLCDATELTLK